MTEAEQCAKLPKIAKHRRSQAQSAGPHNNNYIVFRGNYKEKCANIAIIFRLLTIVAFSQYKAKRFILTM